MQGENNPGDESASEHPIEHTAEPLQEEEVECPSSEESISSETVSKSLTSISSPSYSSLSSRAQVSSDEDLPGTEQPSYRVPTLPTFKLVGDNLDKSVRPRDMRMDCQTQALHYFHMYAVRDRINLAEFTDNPSLPEVSLSDLKTILPTTQDQEVLQKNFAILIARTLTKHMPFFKKFGSGLERHLVHERYEEMSAKSEVVSVYITTKIARTEVPIRLDTESLAGKRTPNLSTNLLCHAPPPIPFTHRHSIDSCLHGCKYTLHLTLEVLRELSFDPVYN